MTELNLGHAQQGLEHLGGCFRILPTTSAHLTSLQGPAVDNLFAVAHHSCLPSLVTTFSLIYGKVLVTVQLYSKQLKTYGRAYTVILGYFFFKEAGTLPLKFCIVMWLPLQFYFSFHMGGNFLG